MGTYLAAASPLACDAADRRRVSLELSLASVFQLNLGSVRGGSAAIFARFDQAGSTSMWAGLRFINGYSPIRPAGVAREFYATIHGEIDPAMGMYLLNDQAGPDGELARLGVDGIVVAREVDIFPQPVSEWELITAVDEGRVFQRRGAPFARVRSVTSIDSRPNEQFIAATISRINDSRK